MGLDSKNFGFLASHDKAFASLGAQAEYYFRADPAVCLIKLRQLGEGLAQQAAAYVGIYASTEEPQIDLLRRLQERRALPLDAATLFHSLRKAGNQAAHNNVGTESDALHALKLARQLAVWFHRTFGKDPRFSPGAFVPPEPPVDATDSLKTQIAELQKALEESRSLAQTEAQQKLSAEERAAKEAAERLAIEALVDEFATREAEMVTHLSNLQAEAANRTEPQLDLLLQRSLAASEAIELDEPATRQIIDEQLRAAGWEVDSQELTYGNGVRPAKSRNMAIAEWPTANGPADYVLFIGLEVVAVVEAKKQARDVSGSVEQAKRYSRGYVGKSNEAPPNGGPWGDYRIPFLFATNGRPYLAQLATKSGTWFLDARKPKNLSRPIDGWYTPQGLEALLAQDFDRSHDKLRDEPTDYLGLRDYQIKGIHAVEEAIAAGQRAILLAMATGTGKTKTCIGLCYRLLKTKRFRRVLFLVDRSALGIQTQNAFKDARLENLQTFTDIFDLKELPDIHPDPDTKVQVATVQGMVKRVLFDDENIPSPDTYDCIVIDEAHRGYALDRELGETELTFRNEADYISKYRRVLEHFDAVKIALTATPAAHTVEIFGRPVYEYNYREAVIDGYLVDHEPPTRIITGLAEDGIHWQVGEQVETYSATTGEVQLSLLPDEVHIEIEQFNRRVLTEGFNRAVCKTLAKHIDPSLEEKTLIFCVSDSHADMVVRLLKQAFAEAYGEVEDDAVLKITGRADRPLELIRRFRNERLPNVVVTVDLLTTGVDIPAICNLVFLRRVASRILYSQMIGRATRRCDDIGKEVFRIYDAVDLYSALSPFTDMKPVVQNPSFSFEQLVTELVTVTNEAAREEILEQLIAKLERKHRRLDDEAKERVEAAAGMEPEQLATFLREQGPTAAANWFKHHLALPKLLDATMPGGQRVFISHHEDEVRRVERGYGGAARPDDYLEGFAKFLNTNMNHLPALVVVTQRPRDMTRKQLKELKTALDDAGFSEATLRSAWKEKTNQDIAASIVGYVRQVALGDPLMPYADRVERALRKVLASQTWTDPQKKWLERIGKQLLQETVVDRAALDGGQFKTAGGFERINKVFGGKLEQVLGDLHDGVWKEVG